MEGPSTNHQEAKKRAGRIVPYVVLWLLLLGGVGCAIWFDIIKSPGQEKIAQDVDKNIETSCGKLLSRVQSDCQARIAQSPLDSSKDSATWCKDLLSDVQSDCQNQVRSATVFAVQSFDERFKLRQRLWLILLALLIGILPLWAAARKLRTASEKTRPLWLVITCVVILLLVLGVISIVVWNKSDAKIAYIPVPVLEWGFAGGMLAVIHHLASGDYSSVRRLYPWVVARPVIGFFMGGVVYAIATAGLVLTNINASENPGMHQVQLTTNLWLNALAFVAAYNDKFSEAVIGRFTSGLLQHREKKSDAKEGNEDNR
jgi:hypothetical protein